jgi:membrane protease YdiL (CAAX protease family)
VGGLVHSHRARLVGWSLFVVALSALQFAARFSGSRPAKDAAYSYASSVSAAIFFLIVLGLALLITVGLPRRSFFGLRRPSSWKRAAGIAALVSIAVVVVNGVVAQFARPGKEQGLVPTYWDSRHVVQFAAYAAVIVLIGPIVEELMFRGVGYGLLEPFGRGVACVVVGVAFGLVHGLVAGFPIIATFGIGLTYLRAKTGSIYPCMLLHASYNALGLALGVATGS